MKNNFLERTEILIGAENINRLINSKVLIVGIGGVGSYATEALCRAGISDLTLVDFDDIQETNINRQLHATYETIGQKKVQEMKKRLLIINPNLNIKVYENKISNLFNDIDWDFDYVIDAIDDIDDKVELIKFCKNKNLQIISSMAAGNKLDPSQFKISKLKKTKVCPIAKKLRYILRDENLDNLLVAYSEEKPRKNPDATAIGSVSFVPPSVGLLIASKVITDLIEL